MEDPNWRSESQLVDIRSFKAAALEMQSREDRLVSSHLAFDLEPFQPRQNYTLP